MAEVENVNINPCSEQQIQSPNQNPNQNLNVDNTNDINQPQPQPQESVESCSDISPSSIHLDFVDGQQQRRQNLNWCDEVPALEFEAPPIEYPVVDLKHEYQHQHHHHHNHLGENNGVPNQSPQLGSRISSSSLPLGKNPSEDDLLHLFGHNVSNILGDDDLTSDITVEMVIPSDKVGLIIGKGGKTIKSLQEKSGSKMNIIQETSNYEEHDKKLRLYGPADLVEHARQLVIELISKTPGNMNQFKQHKNEYERSAQRPASGPRNQSNDYNNNNSNNSQQGGGGGGPSAPSSARLVKSIRFPVPKLSVGLIIGRNGETIKRIKMETGVIEGENDTAFCSSQKITLSSKAKVQFDSINSSLGDMDEQSAIITGKPDQIRHACNLIEDLVNTAVHGNTMKKEGSRINQNNNNNGRRDHRQHNLGTNNNYYDDHNNSTTTNNNNNNNSCSNYIPHEERINVPVGKIKLVIGKGRENIRNIMQQSGAHCEIDRNAPPDSLEKAFIIKGARHQVECAKDMIMDKVNSKRHHRSQGRGQFNNNNHRISSEHFVPGAGSTTNNSNSNNTTHNIANNHLHHHFAMGDPPPPSASWPPPSNSIEHHHHQQQLITHQFYDPNNSASSPTTTSQPESQHNNRHYRAQPDFGYSQWLEYFQPERQQAQAMAWNSAMKAEQQQEQDTSVENSIPISTTATTTATSCSPEEPEKHNTDGQSDSMDQDASSLSSISPVESSVENSSTERPLTATEQTNNLSSNESYTNHQIQQGDLCQSEHPITIDQYNQSWPAEKIHMSGEGLAQGDNPMSHSTDQHHPNTIYGIPSTPNYGYYGQHHPVHPPPQFQPPPHCTSNSNIPPHHQHAPPIAFLPPFGIGGSNASSRIVTLYYDLNCNCIYLIDTVQSMP